MKWIGRGIERDIALSSIINSFKWEPNSLSGVTQIQTHDLLIGYSNYHSAAQAIAQPIGPSPQP